MKCPKCKNEVARLINHVSTAYQYPAGLCQTCDAVERASDVPPLRPPADTPPPIEKRKGTEHGRPARRKRGPYGPRKPKVAPNPPQFSTVTNGSVSDCLKKMKDGYDEELLALQNIVARTQAKIAAMEVKLEVVDELLVEWRGK